jgi:hypothetical protein
MDSALGRHNFSVEVARRQADSGIFPDTISTDTTPGGYGAIVYSVMQCIAKFLFSGTACRMSCLWRPPVQRERWACPIRLGAIAVRHEADITVFDRRRRSVAILRQAQPGVYRGAGARAGADDSRRQVDRPGLGSACMGLAIGANVTRQLKDTLAVVATSPGCVSVPPRGGPQLALASA